MKRKSQKLIAAFTRGFAAKTIAAAVSGGVDSVAMLLLLHNYCRMKKVRLCVFHVDHSLRDSSSADRKWVGELASKLGLDFYWRKASMAESGTGTKKGSEEWAREFRYNCFAQMCVESGAEIVATGHTADDQCETVVMRLLRGCSLQGMAGIRARAIRRKEPAGLKLWRPVLNIKREDLEEYLRLCEQDWREDETNSSDNYFRNRVRHHVVPLLQTHGKNFSEHLAALAEDIGATQSLLYRRARFYLRRHKCAEYLEIEMVADRLLRREIIRQWLIEMGLGKTVSRAMIERLDDLWLTNSSGRAVDYRKIRFIREKQRLVFVNLFPA